MHAYQETLTDLADVLITDEAFHRATQFWTCKPTEKLIGDEDHVYTLLRDRDRWGMEWHQMYLIYQRSFLASCSSSWSYGLHRFPGCPADNSVRWEDITQDGQCDIFEEVSSSDLRKGLLNAQHRIATGRPASAGKFGFVVLDMHNAYGEGWRITDEFFDRLNKFRKHLNDCHLNQAGYQVIRQQDDHAVIILEPEPDIYDKYILEGIRSLHQDVSIVVGISHGDLYYYGEREFYSDAINRLWYSMKNVSAGAIVVNGSAGAEVARRIHIDHDRWLSNLNQTQ